MSDQDKKPRQPISPNRRIYKLADIIEVYSMSRSSIYRAMADDGFPESIKLSSRSVGWIREAVDRWIAERPAGIAPCADNEQYQTEGYLASRPGSQRDAA